MEQDWIAEDQRNMPAEPAKSLKLLPPAALHTGEVQGSIPCAPTIAPFDGIEPISPTPPAPQNSENFPFCPARAGLLFVPPLR
jgi:hypothetical protein